MCNICINDIAIFRPHIRLLIGDFHAYLIDNKIRRQRELRKKPHYLRNNDQTSTNIIRWIERLLETPIEDGRKYALWRILCPYMVNIKKLEYEKAFKILKIWLENCNDLRGLDFNPYVEIRTRLRYTKDYNPISINTLKNDNRDLYLLLIQKMIIRY